MEEKTHLTLDDIKQFIKDNLTIEFDAGYDYDDYDRSHKRVTVSLILDGNEISSASFSI